MKKPTLRCTGEKLSLLHLQAFILCFFLTQPAVFSQEPVKVFILSGQSNMVGAGKIDGGSSRWGSGVYRPSRLRL